MYREQENRHYRQNSAATQAFRLKSVYREQKNRHYRQNSAATQAFRLKRVCRERLHCHFGSKECVADRVGSKECVAWKQCAACDTGGLQVGFRRASRDWLVSKNHLAVSRRKIKGAGKEVGEVGSHEDVHGYVSVAGGRNGR